MNRYMINRVHLLPRSMPLRKFITIILLLATCHAHAAATCGKASATVFAKRFYAVYGNHGLLSVPSLTTQVTQVTPLFYDALMREEACTKTEGICSLDYFILAWSPGW